MSEELSADEVIAAEVTDLAVRLAAALDASAEDRLIDNVRDSVDTVVLLTLCDESVPADLDVMAVYQASMRQGESFSAFAGRLLAVDAHHGSPNAIGDSDWTEAFAATGRMCALRDFRPTDLPFLAGVAADPEARFSWHGRGAQLPPEALLDTSSAALHFVIVSIRDRRDCGLVSVHDLEAIHQRASISVLVSRWYQTVGVGLEALVLASQYAMRVYPLRKLYSETTERELPQFASALDRGWIQREAILKDYVFVDGAFRDAHILSITREGLRTLAAQLALQN